jgi:hypothetical protein
MQRRDMEVSCTLLIKRNNDQALMDRALLCIQWQLIGRISEAAALKTMDLNVIENAMTCFIARSKTTTDQNLMVFPHPRSYFYCPIHALASWCMVSRSRGNIFPAVRIGDGVSKHMNLLLTKLTEEAEQNQMYITSCMTSHSTRSGAATALHIRKECNKLDIDRRGGWSTDNNPSNRYMRTTDYLDGILGKALSGWESSMIEDGGINVEIQHLPFISSSLKTYSLNLFGTTDLVDPVRELFCLNLLMYYNQLKAEYPGHIICQYMERCMTESTLKDWSTQVMDKFKQLNRFISEEASISTVPIALQPVLQNQLKLSTQVESQDKILLNLCAMVNQMSTQQQFLMNFLQNGFQPPIPLSPVPASSTPIERPTVIPQMFLPRQPQPITHSLPSAKSLEVERLFILWYDTEMHTYTINNDNSQLELMESYKFVIAHSKCLLKSGTQILPRPTEANELKIWQTSIVSLGKQVTEGWLQLRESYDKCTGKTTVWTIKRLIPMIKVKNPTYFDFSKVIDTATSPEKIWKPEQHRKSKKQRIL